MNIKKELNNALFAQHEAKFKHLGFKNEFNLYNAIISGNENEVKRVREINAKAKANPKISGHDGLLSHDPLRNQKYHFVILSALIARFCMESGLDRETSYSLCDIYIQKMDILNSPKEIEDLKTEMIYEYTALMKENNTKGVFSRQISKCIDYINDNIFQKINLETIADELAMNPSYLSKLFSKEVGLPISAYIKRQRLQIAANMLTYAEYSISDISGYLCFSSQSHFTKSFQEVYNMTPKKYRDLHTTNILTKPAL